MINKMLATGLLALVVGGIAGQAANADPYWGYGGYGNSEARYEHHRAVRQRNEAALDAMEGNFGAARYHAHQARRAQREANWDRYGGW